MKPLPHRPDLAGDQPEPRWPALVALLVVGALNLGLSTHVALGPRWLPLVLIAILLVPTTLTHARQNHFASQVLGHIVSGVATLFLGASVFLLVSTLGTHKLTGVELLRSAGVLWVSNVVNFALWYWRLDAGGPVERERVRGHVIGDFLFPQMTLPPENRPDLVAGVPTWSPHFMDYLFLAFNTSTALSPTDVPVLSPWAKALMITQSSLSLVIIALLASRAVNIM